MTVSTSTSGSAGAAAPERMRAAVLDRSGALHVTGVPLPQPVGAEVLVRIVAAGMGPLDGAEPDLAVEDHPAVLGSDFSGTVVQVPYEGFWLQPGDEVFGVSGF